MKQKKIKIKKTPIQCKSLNDLCSIPRDNIHMGEEFWGLHDGYQVSIVKQRQGEKSTESISLPKKKFDEFVRWYVTGSKRGKINGL